MISNDPEVSVGDEYYVPFWIILPFLDVTPPDPFIKASVVDTKLVNGMSPNGQVQVLCCDLKCPNQIVATGIPAEYLIKPEDLPTWANKIADWFRDFPNDTTTSNN